MISYYTILAVERNTGKTLKAIVDTPIGLSIKTYSNNYNPNVPDEVQGDQNLIDGIILLKNIIDPHKESIRIIMSNRVYIPKK